MMLSHPETGLGIPRSLTVSLVEVTLHQHPQQGLHLTL